MLEEISEKIINERKYLYSNLKIFEKMGESGLCFLISPDKDLADILRELIIYYIKINLFYQNHDKSIFSMSIKELEDRILELPNITSGGAIYPKNESALIFSEICRILYLAYENFFEFVDKVDIPTIRFKHGTKSSYSSRPYATNKLHSDAWVGQPGDAIFSYGVYGDFENMGVEFYFPEKIKSNFLERIDNYNIGKSRFTGIKKIGEARPNKAVVFDHLVLHKTMDEKDSGGRISIDLALVMKIQSSTSYRTIINADLERYNYHPVDFLRKIGNSIMISPKQSLADLKESKPKSLNIKSYI